jgi:hypothetical protein
MKRVMSPLIVVHRYLGVAFCLIFLTWFASGIVMIYKRMPVFSAEERLARLPALDGTRIRLTPKEAFAAAQMGEAPQRVLLTSLQARPVYRFVVPGGTVGVFADDGSYGDLIKSADAVAIGAAMFPESRASVRHLDSITEPDQWTIGNRFAATGALHRISLGDAAGTELYVTEASGEIAMKTDRSSRFWGYAGPVMHWFYFAPLRAQHGPLWSNLIIYGSVVGCVLCLLGLTIGVYRFSAAHRFKHGTSFSPYAGWLQWHHYAGLVFGVIAFTWTFSGLLTMTPWSLFPDSSPSRAQTVAIRGDGIDVAAFSLSPAGALAELQKGFAPKELELVQFMGQRFYAAYRRPDVQGAHQDAARYAPAAEGLSRVLVAADGDVARIHPGFTRQDLLAAARAAMPGMEPAEVTWLTDYDAYYYERTRTSRLPALRVKFDDPDKTWLYLDARDGSLVLAEVRGSRAERWLYQGLHSLDFPGFYQAAWAWYPVMVVLGLGGVALSLTSLVAAWMFLRSKGKGVVVGADLKVGPYTKSA